MKALSNLCMFTAAILAVFHISSVAQTDPVQILLRLNTGMCNSRFCSWIFIYLSKSNDRVKEIPYVDPIKSGKYPLALDLIRMIVYPYVGIRPCYSHDGRGNNAENPSWGAVEEELLRPEGTLTGHPIPVTSHENPCFPIIDPTLLSWLV